MNDRTKLLKDSYNELATKMDEDYAYKCQLRDYFIKHGSIPDSTESIFGTKEHHRESFESFKKENFKSWRCQPAVRKRIMKAAKRASRAKGLEKLTAIEKK